MYIRKLRKQETRIETLISKQAATGTRFGSRRRYSITSQITSALQQSHRKAKRSSIVVAVEYSQEDIRPTNFHNKQSKALQTLLVKVNNTDFREHRISPACLCASCVVVREQSL